MFKKMYLYVLNCMKIIKKKIISKNITDKFFQV